METPKEKSQREEELRQEITTLERRSDYIETYGTETGRKVLRDMIRRGHMLETSYTRNADTYFYEGERNFVLRTMALIPGIFGEVLRDILQEQELEVSVRQAQILRILEGETND